MRLGTGLLIAATVVVAVISVGATFALLSLQPAAAAEAAVAGVMDPSVVRWGLVAAAASAGMSALGAGYAVAHVGSAAVGALAERPELLGRVLILVGLAEGIAIYGLIVAILIFNRVG